MLAIKRKIKNVKFKKFSNNNGELIFIESKKIFKNGFKRFFSVSAKKKVTRGYHSHRKCTQILFSLNGDIVISIFKKKNLWKVYKLKKNTISNCTSNNYLKIKYLKSNTILGVLCDKYYDEKIIISAKNNIWKF